MLRRGTCAVLTNPSYALSISFHTRTTVGRHNEVFSVAG
ncbi:hypothetical protein Ae406Ps2_0202c [Pseudonocardia sp. Ae406_Ps2]|nr:hypothetical protein Ae406Ps2_0202c [Pseudonocardia sp. Ae406_Ps2]OLM08005.1 hypothetical protein Ae331Ps2_5715 [Pseudonocardia sp. Ae331_Ps2]